MIRFEDMIFDQKQVLNTLTPFLIDVHNQFTEINRSTKSTTVTLADYQDYYRQELWREDLRGSEQLINESIDWSLIEGFGYRPVSNGVPAVIR